MEKNAPARNIGVAILLAALGLAGCKKMFGPSFPGEKLAESVVQLCVKEYKRQDVSARREGGSLQVLTPFEGEVESDLSGLDKAASDLLDDLLQAATRVVLSTDDPPEFVEVILRNPVTGATFSIWRYVGDVRRFMFTELPTLESVERMVMVREEGFAGEVPEGLLWPRPVTMPEFLGRQLAQRLKRHAGVEAREDLSTPGELGIVVENWDDLPKLGKAQESVLRWLQDSSRTVLGSYRYGGFQGVVLLNGRGVTLSRWSL